MIAQLRGTLVHKAPTRAVVDVQGVGYGVAISLHTYGALPPAGAEVRLFTYTYVREDRLELYGFAEEAEKEMFELLIGVSGIGPNSARTILSGLSVGDLQRAIWQERTEDLRSVRGVGPKTAMRVVLELKDKVQRLAPSGAEGGPPASEDPVVGEAVLALEALGIAGAAARKAVTSARGKLAGDLSVQDLVKQALRER